MPINYTDRMPRFVDQQELRDLITGQAKPRRELIIERTIFSKAQDWRYEMEWRVYRPSTTTSDEFLDLTRKSYRCVFGMQDLHCRPR